jgi:peptidoglycan/LPS O-acetylase OafA/YrhL
MARRVELGAGLAAAVLAVLTLVELLAAPIVAVCPGHVVPNGDCSTSVRFITLLAAGTHVHASTWYFITAMALVTLAGGVGAALHVLVGMRAGVLLLWPAAVLAFAGCALTGLAGGALSLFFLPPVLALCIAAFAALIMRRRRPDATGQPGESPAEENGSRWFGRGELS